MQWGTVTRSEGSHYLDVKRSNNYCNTLPGPGSLPRARLRSYPLFHLGNEQLKLRFQKWWRLIRRGCILNGRPIYLELE